MPGPGLRDRIGNCEALLSSIAASLMKDHVGGLFADHVHRADNEEAWNSREDRGVHDAQVLGTVHAKVAGQDAVLLASADRTAAGSVMSPARVSDVVSQLVIG